jgi:hypothetical protein
VYNFYTQEWWDKYVDTAEAYTQWRNTIGQDYLDVQDARDLGSLGHRFSSFLRARDDDVLAFAGADDRLRMAQAAEGVDDWKG